MTVFLAGGIAWALKRAEEVPNHVRAEGSFWEVLTYKHKKSFGGFTPEEVAEAVARGRALRDQMVLEFPNLAIAFHPVPDEENGFLQVIEFTNSDSGESSAPRNLRKLVDEKTFDVAHAEQLLNEHAEYVNQVSQIAALSRRSSTVEPEIYNGFLDARTNRVNWKLLMVKAQLAAERGDDVEARAQVSLALNYVGHLEEVEVVSLLAETVATLGHLDFRATLFGDILPALEGQADLEAWKSLMMKDYSPQRFARVMRGEWHIIMEHFLCLCAIDGKGKPFEDLEQLARVMSSGYGDLVSRLESMDMQEFYKHPGFALSKNKVWTLSEESREAYESLHVGAEAWAQGYLRVTRQVALGDSVLDLLIAESEGLDLSQVTETRVLDPETEKPFQFDPVTRTVSLVDNEKGIYKIEPIALPW